MKSLKALVFFIKLDVTMRWNSNIKYFVYIKTRKIICNIFILKKFPVQYLNKIRIFGNSNILGVDILVFSNSLYF